MKIQCYEINVNCQKNDPVDIRCGGPDYLGYDFCVEKSKVDEMIKFIKETCKNLNVPIVNISYFNDFIYEKEANQVWTKEKIYKCIENNEAGLDLSYNNEL